MTTIYICRHGETENNKRHRLMGWLDTPLTERGKQDARSSAAKLANIPIDQIISSDLGRAFMTAYIIAKQIRYSGSIETKQDLREMNYGELANQPYEAYPKLSPEDNLVFTPPYGESLLDMQARVLECINQIGASYAGQTVLIVAHDGTINAIRAYLSHHSVGQEDERHNAHDFVGKIVWDAGALQSFAELASTPLGL